MTAFTVNDRPVRFLMDPGTPLLWALRDTLQLTGTKYGCGVAQCGACTVFVDGSPQRACVVPVSAVLGRKITTIEAADNSRIGKAVQAAVQCMPICCLPGSPSGLSTQ